MTNEETIEVLDDMKIKIDIPKAAITQLKRNEALDKAIKALEQTRWIPIKTRPLTEEEKEEIGHEYAFMYDCPLPDDGQEVLITDCYGNVEIDTFCRDYEGFYFENNCDDGEVIAWQPKPQSYKAESEVNDEDA